MSTIFNTDFIFLLIFLSDRVPCAQAHIIHYICLMSCMLCRRTWLTVPECVYPYVCAVAVGLHQIVERKKKKTIKWQSIIHGEHRWVNKAHVLCHMRKLVKHLVKTNMECIYVVEENEVWSRFCCHPSRANRVQLYRPLPVFSTLLCWWLFICSLYSSTASFTCVYSYFFFFIIDDTFDFVLSSYIMNGNVNEYDRAVICEWCSF